MKKLKLILAPIVFFFLIVVFTHDVNAATRVWDGGGGADTNWSTCANWDGPDICPVAGDTATFNGTSTNNSTIDSGFGGSIGVININSGYTGTITQAETLAITSTMTFNAGTSGTYNAGSQILSLTSASTGANLLTVGGGILNLGSSTFTSNGGVTISSGTLTLGNGADLNGTSTTTALRIQGGTFNAPSGTMTLAGGLSISGTPTFNANGGTLTFDGNTSVTLACNNVTFNRVVLDEGLTGNTGIKTINSDCSFPIGANPTENAAIILNGTLSGSGTLTVNSARSSDVLTLNTGSSLSVFTGLIINDTASALKISGATVDFSNYSLVSLNSGFTMASGTFTAPNVMTISAFPSFTNTGGTFNPNGGTVVFTGSFNNLVGSTTFYNLTKTVTSSSTLQFAAGTTTTIQGTLNLQGSGSSNRLSLKSSTGGTASNINAQGGRVLNSLNVQDSNNINSTVMLADANSIDTGNNTGWSFGSSNISFYLDYPGGNSHITNTNPTYRWKKATVTNNSAITKYELYIQPKDLISNASIGTRLYIDNILPNIGDNKKYAYYPTYTLYDDGNFLNLSPTSYILTPGKYNFRVVAHDSAGNVREESVDFFVDSTTLTTNNSVNQSFNNPIVPAGNFVALAGRPTTQPVAETPNPEPTFLPIVIPETVKEVVQNNFPWWILVLILIILLLLLLFWKRRKQR